jgi:uncharacterized phage-associated protein
MTTAREVALYYMSKDNLSLQNTYEGNKKLQKLLVMANLIHLAETSQPLFNDEIYAFKQGCVVEEIRKEYKLNWYGMACNSRTYDFNFQPNQKRTLDIVIDIFGGLSATVLSSLHHLFDFWKTGYNNSLDGDVAYKCFAAVSTDDMRPELDKIKEVLKAYKQCENDKVFIEINNIKFYYDPSMVTINTSLKDLLTLYAQTADDDSYVINFDEAEGYSIL